MNGMNSERRWLDFKKKSDQRFILHFVGFSEMLHTFEKEYFLYYVIIKYLDYLMV